MQDYTCPVCGRTYTTLQAPFLIKPDGMFHCEDDDAVLEAGGGEADGMSRRERSKAVKAKQARLCQEQWTDWQLMRSPPYCGNFACKTLPNKTP